jgi:lipoprotein-anchoring transpeptidase ErfK/SrfK
MRSKEGYVMWRMIRHLAMTPALLVFVASSYAQFYPMDQYGQYGVDPGIQQYIQGQYGARPPANLQYDPRDAERILRDQVARSRSQSQVPQGYERSMTHMPQGYENYYGHRLQDEGQVQSVMEEARNVAVQIKQRNGKPFIVVDKRNFQFYLFDQTGRLLRIGPVAIGKGKTHVGAFETPVGVFPIKSKVPVDDWIRPDWYFIEEGEPIPKKWEDRRVPGFFRYKLVFDGSRYIHYAEATGGRLTHGCLGLDWQDAEAVFHTMQVGSYCIIIDNPFLARLARGEFPIQKQAQKKPEDSGERIAADNSERKSAPSQRLADEDEKVFNSLW